MLTFLLYTIIFWIANTCFVKIAYILIQPGQMLGGWQNTLQKLHDANSRFLNSLAKPLGDCELCFSHMITVITFICYYIFANVVFHKWVSDPVTGIVLKSFVNVVWYLVYVSIGTIVSLRSLFKRKR